MTGDVVAAIRDVSIEVAKNSTILTEHDRKLDTAVAEMRAHMDAKEEHAK